MGPLEWPLSPLEVLATGSPSTPRLLLPNNNSRLSFASSIAEVDANSQLPWNPPGLSLDEGSDAVRGLGGPSVDECTGCAVGVGDAVAVEVDDEGVDGAYAAKGEECISVLSELCEGENGPLEK